MPHASTRLLAVVAAGALASLPLVPAHASNGNRNDKQSICHRTNSNTNPYVLITPNKNGDVHGHAGHTGPVWDPSLKAQHVKWGDIIPPFSYNDHGTTRQYPGQNWTAQGQAIFARGCGLPITVAVDKTNDADGNGTYTDDETATAAGATVRFRVVITNTSSVPAVVGSITDVVDGSTVPFTCDPDVVGTTIPAGGAVTCLATVTGYSPADGAARTNTVTVVLHQVGNVTNNGAASDTSTVRTTVPSGLGGGGTTGGATGGSTGGTTGDTTGDTTGGTTGSTGGTTGDTTGGATGGTTSGFGGGGTGAVSAPGSGEGSGDFTGGGGTTTTAAPTGAGGSALPFTGLPVAALATLGVLASLGGALLLVLVHRSRAY